MLQICRVLFNDTYRSYFEYQAINHPSLNHQAGQDKVFEVIGVEEALGDFRTLAIEKSFIMRLIMYTYRLTAGGSETLKLITGGFVIARHHSNRSSGKDDFFDAMTQSEQVMDEIIEKMIADSQNGHPMFYYSLEKGENINVQPKINTGDTGYSGWLCTFPTAVWWRNCLELHTDEDWKQLTPDVL